MRSSFAFRRPPLHSGGRSVGLHRKAPPPHERSRRSPLADTAHGSPQPCAAPPRQNPVRRWHSRCPVPVYAPVHHHTYADTVSPQRQYPTYLQIGDSAAGQRLLPPHLEESGVLPCQRGHCTRLSQGRAGRGAHRRRAARAHHTMPYNRRYFAHSSPAGSPHSAHSKAHAVHHKVPHRYSRYTPPSARAHPRYTSLPLSRPPLP